MKVARKHIIAAIEYHDQLLIYPKYVIKAKSYTGKDKRLNEFGWTITVLPFKKD
jgi:hypothetical protein